MSGTVTKRQSLIERILYSPRVAPFVFVLPFLLSFSIFFVYPIISTILMSFERVLGMHNNVFIGLQNYKRLIDVHFFMAIKTSTLYAFFTILVLIPIPVIFSVFLSSRSMLGKNLFRSILFVPALTSVIAAGVAFRLIFADSAAWPANRLMEFIGVHPVKWQLNYSTGMFIMVVLASWRWMGVNIIYFLSGLHNIPVELYESADMDGAGALSKFVYITLPLLRPIIVYVLTISIYGGYAMFAESYVYWTEGTPGDIGLSMVRYIYQQAFGRNDLGYGSAIGIALLAIVFTINLIQLRFFGLFRTERTT
ncbi:MAG TPA: sugar ABC transporter permease [Spirochaetia bacterium]|nr:sugar ABC transporter permease [Spirochaetia bacterium]